MEKIEKNRNDTKPIVRQTSRKISNRKNNRNDRNEVENNRNNRKEAESNRKTKENKQKTRKTIEKKQKNNRKQ